MRNAGFTPDCGCGPVIGEIRNGFKYPFGTVTTEQLRQVLTDVNNELDRLGNYCNSLNEKESVNEANIKNNKENIVDIKTAISGMQSSITQTKENVIALMSSIEKVDTKTETNKKSITDITEQVNDVRKVAEEALTKAESGSGSGGSGTSFVIQENEPTITNVIWIKPLVAEDLLALNINPNGYEYQANVDGVDYGVENAVGKPEQLTTTNYLFDIIK